MVLNVACGIVAGVVSSVVANPTDVLKVSQSLSVVAPSAVSCRFTETDQQFRAVEKCR